MAKVQRFGFAAGKRQTGGAVVTVAEIDGPTAMPIPASDTGFR